jgi:hypothetical protein
MEIYQHLTMSEIKMESEYPFPTVIFDEGHEEVTR